MFVECGRLLFGSLKVKVSFQRCGLHFKFCTFPDSRIWITMGFFREGLQCNSHDVITKLSSIKGTINSFEPCFLSSAIVQC